MTQLPPIEFDLLLSEVGNARRLLRDYGSELRFCKDFDSLMVWNGKYWEKDRKGHRTTALTHRMIQEMRNESLAIIQETQVLLAAISDNTTDEAEQQREQLTARLENGNKLYAWSVKSESDRSIRGTVHQFCSLLEVQTVEADYDKHMMLFNCQNGTLNLETFELKEHTRTDLLTKIAPVSFDPAATCARFEQFMQEIFPECPELKDPQGLVTYMQRVCGYSLTGRIVERVLVFLMGNGANGKSAFVNIMLQAIFGVEPDNYGIEASFSTFLQGRFGNDPGKIRSDLMRLRGKRFITASEADDPSARLDTENLKKLSGDNYFAGRSLYEPETQFKPQGKLFLQMNNQPRIFDTTESIWTRVKKVPFEASFKIDDARTDVDIAKKIASTEASGILNWMLLGLRDVLLAWKENRAALPAPSDVEAATGEYRKDQSQVGRFLEENYRPIMKTEEGANVSASQLYQHYSQWCAGQGEKFTRTATAFSLEVARHYKSQGVSIEKRMFGEGRKMHWFGITEMEPEGPVV